MTAPLMLEAGWGGEPKSLLDLHPFLSSQLLFKPPFLHTLRPSSCILLNTSIPIEPVPPPPPSSSPSLSSLHPSWSYFDSGLSLFHPPSSQPQPFSSQPQFPIDLLIAVCLWESGRSLPLSLCSPLHGFVFPFPLLSSPSPSSPSPSPHRCSSSET